METIILSVFIFILGLSVGSFLNVLIDRVPNERSILGRSHCDCCKKTLVWYDLVPVFSYFFLRGKCSCCNSTISAYYPLVETLTGLVYVLVWFFFTPQSPFFFVEFFLVLFLISCLIVIFFSDIKYYVIPDVVQVALLTVIAGYLLLTGGPIFQNIIAAGVTMLPILFIHVVTKSKGMGFGDVKFSALMGFLLGIKSGFIALYMAFLLGGIVSIPIILLGKKKLKSKIPFGPFLILGTVIMFFFGFYINEIIFQWYGV